MQDHLFEIDPRIEVEFQVDAMFAALYSFIPDKYHEMIAMRERQMISAIKAAMRLPATEPVRPNPNNWPWDAGDRILVFLTPEEQRELTAIRAMRKQN